MKITLCSIMVNDQEKALDFYTRVLGFEKKKDIPMGSARWLTVGAAEGPDDIELVLEPLEFPPAQVFQKALFDAGIPWTAFAVDDVDREFERLAHLGVVFRTNPCQAGPTRIAIFEDTCGNLIQIYDA